MNKVGCIALLLALAGCSRGGGPLWLSSDSRARWTDGTPAYEYRILDHWDNLDGSVERGYAGSSMWGWGTDSIPEARIREYGALNASIGINGSVLNNVNANPQILSTDVLHRVAGIADILRDYGIRTYLSVNFASPLALGELPTADPLDPEVRAWWKAKAQEIYSLVPDFGGFLVKASSEGQSGPQDFGRSHADGANMLAGALAPHGGIVMWRAFVYAPDSPDRANQAVEEFAPLDGRFAPNVIIQIKNGPIDFMPREPVSPLFFNLPNTLSMPEFQITQEYLGQSLHLVFLAPMWQEFFESCAKVTEARLCNFAIAGVANTGDASSWCGHPFAAANWFAFGRLAWDPTLSSEQIAEEWIRGTFKKPRGCGERRFTREFVEPVKEMMLSSREACVDYMMPLGLHHMMARDHHYGPGVEYDWPGARRDWLPQYYHKAGEDGVGFDRTEATGSANTAQYPEPFRSIYEDPRSCPENLLLWFHHLPWDREMRSGRTLWEEMRAHYDNGVAAVEDYIGTWEGVRAFVDEALWTDVRGRLEAQLSSAREWRETCLGYFATKQGE